MSDRHPGMSDPPRPRPRHVVHEAHDGREGDDPGGGSWTFFGAECPAAAPDPDPRGPLPPRGAAPWGFATALALCYGPPNYWGPGESAGQTFGPPDVPTDPDTDPFPGKV